MREHLVCLLWTLMAVALGTGLGFAWDAMGWFPG